MDLKELLQRRMQVDLSSIAFVHKEEQVDTETFLNICKNVERIFDDAEIKKGNRIIIAANKSIHTMAVIYTSVFKGVIFVPIDVKTAGARLDYIIANCKPSAIFMDDEFAERKVHEDYPDIKIIMFENSVANCSDFQIPLNNDESRCELHFEEMDSSDDVYIIYTSGSTGTPKGVTITRGGLANFINASINHGDFSSETRFLNFIPLYFDPSIMEIFVPWVTGGTIVIFDRFYFINDLVNALRKYEITNFSCTPNVISMLVGSHSNFVKYEWEHLRSIYFGGEVANISDLMTFIKIAPNVRLINEYGPTETTVTCCLYELKEADLKNGILPIGYPLEGVEFLIDRNNSTSEKVGELLVAGVQLMSGYWGEKDNISGCHFTMINDKKYYMTGDMVYEKDGCYFFAGRKDNMIKHRGYRIYLNEIENAVNKLGAGLISHVFYSTETSSIVCAVEVECGDVNSKKVKKEIENDLKNILPSYMIPSRFFFFEKFPRLSNGKIDLIQIKKSCEIK